MIDSIKRNKILWLAAALVVAAGAYLFLGTKAHAADKGGVVSRAEAEAMFPTNPWTAVYAGVGVGTGALTSDFGIGVDGVQFSGRIGGDVQISRILFGIMADYRLDHINSTFGISDPKEWMVAARAGFLLTESTLIYGLVGENWLNVSGMKTQGLAAGGGLEVALTKNWRLGMEYLHVQYDDIPAAREQTATARLIFAFPVK